MHGEPRAFARRPVSGPRCRWSSTFLGPRQGRASRVLTPLPEAAGTGHPCPCVSRRSAPALGPCGLASRRPPTGGSGRAKRGPDVAKDRHMPAKPAAAAAAMCLSGSWAPPRPFCAPKPAGAGCGLAECTASYDTVNAPRSASSFGRPRGGMPRRALANPLPRPMGAARFGQPLRVFSVVALLRFDSIDGMADRPMPAKPAAAAALWVSPARGRAGVRRLRHARMVSPNGIDSHSIVRQQLADPQFCLKPTLPRTDQPPTRTTVGTPVMPSRDQPFARVASARSRSTDAGPRRSGFAPLTAPGSDNTGFAIGRSRDQCPLGQVTTGVRHA